MAGSTYTLHAKPKFSPITTPDRCSHGGSDAMCVNARIEDGPQRGRRQIAVDCSICMACGKVIVGDWTPFRALAALWDEWGWNAYIAPRIRDLIQILAEEAMADAGVKIRRTKRQRHMLVNFGPAGLFVTAMPSGRVVFEQPTAA